MRSLLIYVLFYMLISSCSSEYKVKQQLKEMYGTSVYIPYDSMKCWLSEEDYYTSQNAKSKLTLVVYADTTDCSICYLDQLKLWNNFLKIEKEQEGVIRFVFILEARNGELNDLWGKLYQTKLKHSIYIDDNKCFSKNNPQIPSNRIFHTFLLDESNNIILVGNPLENESIEKLFLKKIDEVRNM